MSSEKANELNWAVKNGDLQGVHTLIESESSLVSYQDANGRSPCHWAADFGQAKVLEYLVSKGAKFDEKDNYGITPLLASVYEGHVDVVAFLVKKGASKSVKGPDGSTPFEAAEKPEIKNLLK
ncbi:hypothetical protein CYY_005421 [Polysphondylium violaceum]|uniref:Myotrophin n=1 Tax=Polysphondylium violaceum TaxID=133409 RepID=A0A8J4V6V3_9MYCE|nr:hypothetical protein CYY_005421 [Polysphondylium violaceum]